MLCLFRWHLAAYGALSLVAPKSTLELQLGCITPPLKLKIRKACRVGFQSDVVCHASMHVSQKHAKKTIKSHPCRSMNVPWNPLLQRALALHGCSGMQGKVWGHLGSNGLAKTKTKERPPPNANPLAHALMSIPWESKFDGWARLRGMMGVMATTLQRHCPQNMTCHSLSYFVAMSSKPAPYVTNARCSFCKNGANIWSLGSLFCWAWEKRACMQQQGRVDGCGWEGLINGCHIWLHERATHTCRYIYIYIYEHCAHKEGY